MKLTWIMGTGPATAGELADEIEQVGVLGAGYLYNPETERRCLWGHIRDVYLDGENVCIARRDLQPENIELLFQAGLTQHANDTFQGTDEARCTEMVRRLRAIP